jgi:hypothetical protein
VAVAVALASVLAFGAADAGALNSPTLLAQGRIGHNAVWGVTANRGSTAGQVCLSTVLFVKSRPGSGGGEGGEAYECRPVSSQYPLVTTQSGQETGRRERTVLVIVAGPSAREAVLSFPKQVQRRVRLRNLSARSLKKAGIEPISYWASGFAGRFCLRRAILYGASGEQLNSSGVTPCTRH